MDQKISLTGLYDESGELKSSYLELAPTTDKDTQYMEVPCGTCITIAVNKSNEDISYVYALRGKGCVKQSDGSFLIEQSQDDDSKSASYEINYGHSPTNFLRIYVFRGTSKSHHIENITDCDVSVDSETDSSGEIIFFDVTTPSGCGNQIAGSITVSIPQPDFSASPIFTEPADCYSCSGIASSTFNTFYSYTTDTIIGIYVTEQSYNSADTTYYPPEYGPP